ncbi:unnamed protein product [Rhizophagus irregularis]|nr:unnamed protein product [Rhizophagus irregularis]CAB5199127.1 unnamed protein product [Rhizophagus irregularis]
MNLEKEKNEMSPVLFVRALYDFESNDASSLSFKTNDIIQVLMQLESGWWDGLCNGERGWFPSNYVTVFDKEGKLINEDEKLYDWILQQTLDGEIFYYNIKTGESSWKVPVNYESPAARDTTSCTSSLSKLSKQFPKNQEPTKNGPVSSYIDDEELDSHVTALVEDDLEKFDPANKVNITSSIDNQLNTASIDVIQQKNLQQSQSIDNLPPNWNVKTTAQGRVYYCNKLTNETTWSLDNINANGQLIKTENNEKSRSDDEIPNELLPQTPTVITPNKSIRFSGSSILMLQNAHEYLTWDTLSQSIDLSIHNLNVAIQENMRQDYPECTSTIVGNVRIMLYATGTVEKDSVAIKKNRNLKNHHRNIMTSLSKLTLSTKVAASTWSPPDATLKMKSDVNEVLDAVRGFILIAQKTVDIRRVDPKIIESATGGSWHGNNLIQTQTNGNKSTLPSINLEDTSVSTSSTNNPLYHLTSDLISSLDKISCIVTQSITLLLNDVRKVIDAPNSFTPRYFSPQLISQTREILTQVGQFLFITENINLKDLDESSFVNINEFNVSKQSLYNNIAGLVMCIQMASDPLFPLNAMDQIIGCANVVDKSVKDIIIITKSLVLKIQEMRSSVVENFEVSQFISNDSNSLDQINGNNTEHSAENQSTISSLDTTSSKSLQTVPENGVVTNDDTISSNNRNFNNDDDPPNSTSRITGKLQRSYTHPSAENPLTSQVISGSNTVGTNVRSKVTKEDGSPNTTQSQKLKEDKPWFLNYDYDTSEIVFNKEITVKGGTLTALVERLTMHDILDYNFIATFLLTYRSFCTTDDFFDMLVKRFMIQPPEGLTNEELEVWQEKKQTPVRLRVFNIMKSWLETYYIDDKEDLLCLEKMREFARTTMYEHMAFASVSLTKVIEKRQHQRKDAKFRELIATNASAPPASILPKNMKKLKFLDIDPLEIARQLTLMESKLYNNIKAVECLGKAWSQSEGDNIAVNVKAMIFNSNKITGWVAESVLNQKEIRKRCMYIKHFVGIADKCRCLNNFNSLTAIISGLYSAPIHRLKRTWEMVNSKTVQTLETLSKIMNSTKNFAEYREMLHSINPPCVPFFGLYLTDLTFIEDGNPDFLKSSNKLINFSKRMKTADVIREIKQYQNVPYNLSSVQEIQMFIDFHLKESKDVKDLYEQSLALEPREREDEKIARLLQESGFL